MNQEARVRLQKAVQQKVDRITKNERFHKVLHVEELEVGAWYIGTSWCNHVAMWDGEFFLSFKGKTVQTMCHNTVGATGFAPYKRVPNPR